MIAARASFLLLPVLAIFSVSILAANESETTAASAGSAATFEPAAAAFLDYTTLKVAPTKCTQMAHLNDDWTKCVLKFARPSSESDDYNLQLRERLWLRGVNQQLRRLYSNVRLGLMVTSVQKIAELLKLSNDHVGSVIALPRLQTIFINFQDAEHEASDRSESTRQMLAGATNLEKLQIWKGGSWTLELSPGSLSKLKWVVLPGVSPGGANSLAVSFATFSHFLLSCPELRRLEIGRLAPEMFRDLPLEHLPLVTSKLEMLSLFNLPGTDEEWRSQQIVLSNILVTAGSNLTSIKLVTASIGLLQQINPAIEELALDSFGNGGNVAPKGRTAEVLFGLVNLRSLQLGSYFEKLSPIYLVALTQLQDLRLMVGTTEIVELEVVIRGYLPGLKRLTIMSLSWVYEQMNHEELERSASHQTEVHGALLSNWGMEAEIMWMNEINSLTDPFRELRNICRTRNITLSLQKVEGEPMPV